MALTADQIDRLFDRRVNEDVCRLGGAEGIAKALQVDVLEGLHDRRRSQEGFGRNELPERPPVSFAHLMWDAYQDRTLAFLTVAAIASLAIGVYEHVTAGEKGWLEGVAIAVAICLVVLVNACNDWQRDRQFRLLSARTRDRHVTVLAGGSAARLSVFELSVGDVLVLEPGEVVPADGVLLRGEKVKCDESGQTGESDAVGKSPEADPFVLAGSKVIDGSGQMVVLAVGVHSSQGRMMLAMHEDQAEPTPLQQKLNVLAERIAKLGAAAAGLMLVALTAKYVAVMEQPSAAQAIQAVLAIIIQAVTVIVVAVPEGLPMAVTIALAYATTEMLKDNNLVRVLAACETMGGATTICSDKTGTLTENRMTVVRCCVGTAHAAGSLPDMALEPLRILSEGIIVNSTAFRSTAGWVGSKTEAALLAFLNNQECSLIRQAARIVQKIPFSSQRKYMMTAVEEFREGKPVCRVHLKGASEIILGMCDRSMGADGQVSAIDPGRCKAVIAEYARESLRTIGIAFKDIVDPLVLSNDGLEHEDGFCLLAIVGIEDPLREGVVEAVAACQRAGISVRMVTGDNVDTARAVASKACILKPGGMVLTGPEFRELKDAQMMSVLPRLQVLARSSPLDKRILVKKLRELGEIVAVTGDGSNDGPALKAAHVGFSMGIAGTEVAKEASSIVLMDDNFASIVKAVSWGRTVHDAVCKFLQFQLTINLSAVVTAASSALFAEKSVLSAIQLLWVNLIMDTYHLLQ